MNLFPATIERVGPDFVAGFVCSLPSGRMLQVAWRTQAPIEPTLDAAKQYAATLLDKLLRGGHQDDADRINWPSVVAAIQRIVSDFNDHARRELYAHTVQ